MRDHTSGNDPLSQGRTIYFELPSCRSPESTSKRSTSFSCERNLVSHRFTIESTCSREIYDRQSAIHAYGQHKHNTYQSNLLHMLNERGAPGTGTFIIMCCRIRGEVHAVQAAPPSIGTVCMAVKLIPTDSFKPVYLKMAPSLPSRTYV